MTEEAPVLPGARFVAWLSFVFGTVVSVAFNVLAAFLPPPHVGIDWHPSVWAVVFSTVWPLGLLLSVELLARTARRRTWFAYVIRYGGMTVVAAFSAVISYQHIRAVLLGWHYPELSATVGPFVIDGLMVLAGYAMIQGALALKQAQAPSGLVVPEPQSPAPLTPERVAEVPRELIETRPQAPLSVPFTPVSLPQPREEQPVNGHSRRVSAAVKTRAPRMAAGPSVEEIVTQVLSDIGDSPTLGVTKKDIQERFRVGSSKANDALKRVREAFEARKGTEEE